MPDALSLDAVRLLYAYDSDAPLAAKFTELQASDSLRLDRFEFSSRHEQRVAGILLSDPSDDAPRPLVLVAHPGTLVISSD